MARQLILLEDNLEESQDNELDWRLDEQTRRLGREGVAAARAALHEALRRPAA